MDPANAERPADPRDLAQVLGDRHRTRAPRRPATGTTASGVHRAMNPAPIGEDGGAQPPVRQPTRTATIGIAPSHDTTTGLAARAPRRDHATGRRPRRPRRTPRGAAGAGRRAGAADAVHAASVSATRTACEVRRGFGTPVPAGPGPGSRPARRTAPRAVLPDRAPDATVVAMTDTPRPQAHPLLPSAVPVGPFRTVPNAVTLVRTVARRAARRHRRSVRPPRPAGRGVRRVLGRRHRRRLVRPPARPGDPGRRRARHRVRPGVHRRAVRRPRRRGAGRAAGRRRLPAVVHGARHDAVAGVPVLAGASAPTTSTLVDRRVWQLNWSPRRQGGQHRRRRRGARPRRVRRRAGRRARGDRGQGLVGAPGGRAARHEGP